MIYERPETEGPLRQGEILTGLRRAVLDLAAAAQGRVEIYPEEFEYAVLISQDCDLEQHHRAALSQAASDKLLPDFLFLPATVFETFRAAIQARDILKRIVLNKDERYHALEPVSADADLTGEGLPSLGMDFKRAFSVPSGEVTLRLREGSARRRTRLATPWAEHLSSRFAYFCSRVGLPKDHDLGVVR